MLSPKQKLQFSKQKKLADKGDTKAIAFFKSVEAQSPAVWEDCKAFFAGESESAGGVKRADIKTDTKLLGHKQFSVAVKLAGEAKQGKPEAVRFFADQEALAAKHVATASVFLAVRDEIFARTNEDRKESIAHEAEKIPADGPAKPVTSQAGVVQNQEKPVPPTSGSVQQSA